MSCSHEHSHSHSHDDDHGHEHDHNDGGVSFFDSAETAKSWSTDPLVVFLNQELSNAILKRFSADIGERTTKTSRTFGCQVLDFGCGTGLLTGALQKHLKNLQTVDDAGPKWEMVGIDVSTAMIDVYNQQHGSYATGLCMDILSPESTQVEYKSIHPSPKQMDLIKKMRTDKELEFDYIISCFALHHCKQPADVVKKLVSHLKPGGKLIFGDFDKEQTQKQGDTVSREENIEFFAPKTVMNWLREAGLAAVKSNTAYHYKKEDLLESNFKAPDDKDGEGGGGFGDVTVVMVEGTMPSAPDS